MNVSFAEQIKQWRNKLARGRKTIEEFRESPDWHSVEFRRALSDALLRRAEKEMDSGSEIVRMIALAEEVLK